MLKLGSLLVLVSGLSACGVDTPVAGVGSEPSSSAAKSPSAQAALNQTTQAAPAKPKPAAAVGSSLANQRFGEAITETTETALASIAGSPADYTDKTVRTTGKVTAVCQAAGCWMEIGDETSRAHIKMSGHSFFVPKTAAGHMAVVQGIVKGGPPVDECGAKDSCGGADNGALARLEIVATGVEFID